MKKGKILTVCLAVVVAGMVGWFHAEYESATTVYEKCNEDSHYYDRKLDQTLAEGRMIRARRELEDGKKCLPTSSTPANAPGRTSTP